MSVETRIDLSISYGVTGPDSSPFVSLVLLAEGIELPSISLDASLATGLGAEILTKANLAVFQSVLVKYFVSRGFEQAAAVQMVQEFTELADEINSGEQTNGKNSPEETTNGA